MPAVNADQVGWGRVEIRSDWVGRGRNGWAVGLQGAVIGRAWQGKLERGINGQNRPGRNDKVVAVHSTTWDKVYARYLISASASAL